MSERSLDNNTQQLEKAQNRLTAITRLATDIINKTNAEKGDPTPRRVYVSATYQSTSDNNRMGLLIFTETPELLPDSFLEITYREHGFGDQWQETEKTYVFSRNNDGDIVMSVSNEVSLDAGNKAIAESALFADAYDGSTVDPDMVAAAQDDLNGDTYETLQLEKVSASVSLALAAPADYDKLEEILTVAKTGRIPERSKGPGANEPNRLQRLNKIAKGAIRRLR